MSYGRDTNLADQIAYQWSDYVLFNTYLRITNTESRSTTDQQTLDLVTRTLESRSFRKKVCFYESLSEREAVLYDLAFLKPAFDELMKNLIDNKKR